VRPSAGDPGIPRIPPVFAPDCNWWGNGRRSRRVRRPRRGERGGRALWQFGGRMTPQRSREDEPGAECDRPGDRIDRVDCANCAGSRGPGTARPRSRKRTQRRGRRSANEPRDRRANEPKARQDVGARTNPRLGDMPTHERTQGGVRDPGRRPRRSRCDGWADRTASWSGRGVGSAVRERTRRTGPRRTNEPKGDAGGLRGESGPTSSTDYGANPRRAAVTAGRSQSGRPPPRVSGGGR